MELRKFTEKLFAALLLQRQQFALDRSDGCRTHIAIGCANGFGIVGDMGKQRL